MKFLHFRVLMTVLFGGASSSNAPEEKSKTKNETLEKEQLNDVKVKEVSTGQAEKLVCGRKNEIRFKKWKKASSRLYYYYAVGCITTIQ